MNKVDKLLLFYFLGLIALDISLVVFLLISWWTVSLIIGFVLFFSAAFFVWVIEYSLRTLKKNDWKSVFFMDDLGSLRWKYTIISTVLAVLLIAGWIIFSSFKIDALAFTCCVLFPFFFIPLLAKTKVLKIVVVIFIKLLGG